MMKNIIYDVFPILVDDGGFSGSFLSDSYIDVIDISI